MFLKDGNGWGAFIWKDRTSRNEFLNQIQYHMIDLILLKNYKFALNTWRNKMTYRINWCMQLQKKKKEKKKLANLQYSCFLPKNTHFLYFLKKKYLQLMAMLYNSDGDFCIICQIQYWWDVFGITCWMAYVIADPDQLWVPSVLLLALLRAIW